MSHPQQQDFCARVKAHLPEYFEGGRVLDCGSLDINGSNRDLFDHANYIGVDVGAGENVDIVSMIHEVGLSDESCDVIVSTECFEHDMHYPKSFRNIVRMLRPGGLFFFTCASLGRPEHGTRRCNPENSPLTIERPGWGDYYKNLTETDVREAIDVDGIFKVYSFEYNGPSGDLYFWGIKRD